MSTASWKQPQDSDVQTVSSTELPLEACPVCGWPVSTMAPTCPQCGHPINPYKSSATMVLVFGILSLLLPMYGIVFGGLAWGFGNREIREIKAGLRVASGRAKARVGRVLGIIGIALWTAFFIFIVIAAIADGSGSNSNVPRNTNPYTSTAQAEVHTTTCGDDTERLHPVELRSDKPITDA